MFTQLAVTTILSGVEPQRGNDEGLTLKVIMLGLLENALRVTGMTLEGQVNESDVLAEPSVSWILIWTGLTLQFTCGFPDAEAK